MSGVRRRSIRKRHASRALLETDDATLSKGQLAQALEMLDVVAPPRPAAQLTVPKPIKLNPRKWFFRTDDGANGSIWNRFSDEAERTINTAMDAGKTCVEVRTGADRWWYHINFYTMTQRNRDHPDHRVRRIRFTDSCE